MNFVKITVNDQACRSESEEERDVIRFYNINLDLVIKYTRADIDKTKYSILFYFTQEDYVAWVYNSCIARNEAFEVLGFSL